MGAFSSFQKQEEINIFYYACYKLVRKVRLHLFASQTDGADDKTVDK